MGGFVMRKFLRQAGYLLLIIILLPYVITVFINGNGLSTGMGGQQSICIGEAG